MFEHPETQYARSGDVHLAYQVVGDGPVDLVLFGTFVSHVELIWDDPDAAGFLERLASFTRLIIFDKRGRDVRSRATRRSADARAAARGRPRGQVERHMTVA